MSIRRMMFFTLGSKIKSLVLAFKTRTLGDLGLFEAETCLETQLTQLDNQSLLDSASFIVTPNGYEENKLYSIVPSKVGTNIVTRSEEFENGIWTKTSLSVIQNTQTSPIGDLTADTMRIGVDAASVRHRFYQLQIFTPNTKYTTSYYLKKANHRWIQLVYVLADFGNNSWANFDLENGVIGNTGAGTIATITDVGNGWYRCTLQGTTNAGGSLSGCEILTTNNTNTVTRYLLYQSTVAEDVCYVWGAQLVTGSTITDYIPTTDRAIINGTIGDMTVVRATTGTRVNSDGFIEQVPYNLFSQTENFENAAWTKQLTTIVQNVIAAPGGAMTADNVIANSGVTYSYTGTLGVNLASNSFPTFLGARTVSIYLKYNGLNRIRFIYGQSTVLSANIYVEVDLQTGTITGTRYNNGGPELASSAFIENVGSGWYRVGFTLIAPVSPTNNRLAVALGDTTKTVANGIDGVYVWGAQMVDGTQPKDYFPTTNRFNIPRIDYSNGGCPSILVEPLRTNLILQSEDFTNGWAVEGTSITSNTQIAPDNLPSADTLSELATNDQHRTYRSAITVTANALYTASFFVKKNNIRYVRLVLSQNASTTIWAGAQFDLDTQTFTSQVGTGGGVFTSATITTFINGWFRISVVGSIPGTLVYAMLALSNGDAMLNTNAGGCPVYLGNTSNSLYVWGGQLELGSNVTSYIPTTTATVTRNADVISNTNTNTLIGQTEGTIFVDYNKVLANDTSRNIISISDSTAINAIEIWDGVGSNLGRIIYTYFANNVIKSAGFGQPTVSPSGRYKICVVYLITPSLVNFKIFINGVKLDDRDFTYTAFSNPLSRINIGNRNGIGIGIGGHNIDFISKTAITETQAINLTTL